MWDIYNKDQTGTGWGGVWVRRGNAIKDSPSSSFRSNSLIYWKYDGHTDAIVTSQGDMPSSECVPLFLAQSVDGSNRLPTEKKP